MTRSRTSAFVALLLAAFSAVPLGARADGPACLASYRRSLIAERSASAAAAFLADGRCAAEAKTSDEASYLELFRAAAELKDLVELVREFDDDPQALRLGLAQRERCLFCQDTRAFMAWAQGLGPGTAPSNSFLRKALYEWNDLPAARRDWLQTQGMTVASWTALPFFERQKKIRAWGQAEYDAIFKALPKDEAELEALRRRTEDAEDAFGHDEAVEAWDRWRAAESAVKGVAEAEKSLKKTRSPKLLAALEAARGAHDLETRLAGLSRVFEGLRIDRPALNAAAPLKPGQGFDAESRRLVSQVLGTALMRAVEGTWAGDELKSFYAKNPLVIGISKEDGSNLASYSEGRINFGQKQIEDFLKGRGKGSRDLLTDSALLGELVRDLAPVFVHETTHQRQDVWAKEQGIPSVWSQQQEQEAMQVEALFLLEKAKRDPGFKKALEKSAESSPNAKSSLSLATRLERNGPEWYRASIRSWHYPEELSLEGLVWCSVVEHNMIAKDIEAELSRRGDLPWPRRARLALGPKLKEEYDSREEFLTAMKAAGTASLEEGVRRQRELAERQPEIYAKYAARLREVNRLTEERLRSLQAAPPAGRKPAKVPSPGAKP